MSVKIEYLDTIGVDSFDLKIVHPFNEKAHAINAMNFEFEYEEAERAGATEYLELLDALERRLVSINTARANVIQYGEAIKQQAQKFTVKKQEGERMDVKITTNQTNGCKVHDKPGE